MKTAILMISMILTTYCPAQETPYCIQRAILMPNSMVRSMTAWSLNEEANIAPDDILPAFIGSGFMGIGIDASGMQLLDCKVSLLENYRKLKNNHTDDLYIFHERMISDHISPGNLMPLGYFDYEIYIDGKAIDILSSDTVFWKRQVNIREATVKTTLTFRQGAQLSILAFCPYESSRVYFRFESQSTDGKTHTLKILSRLQLKLRERSGPAKPIFDKITDLKVDGLTAQLIGEIKTSSVYKPLEDYNVAYAVSSTASSKAGANLTAIWAELEFESCSVPQTRDVCFYIGSSKIDRNKPQDISKAIETFNGKGFDQLLNGHKADYAQYYDAGAQISIGDIKREMLYNNSLYLFRSGSTFQTGITLQFLLFHPDCWFGATFWDTTFAADGLGLANHIEPVECVVKWLAKAAQPHGRTYPWILRYDGSSAMPCEWTDTGYLVNASHAMTAIKLYEITKDKQTLSNYVYPIVKKVADYVASERLIKEDGHYIGATAGHDINTALQKNETYTTVWYGVILRKAEEYAKLLDVDGENQHFWHEISSNLLLEKGPNGYGESSSKSEPGNWISMLLYPTEASPLIDMEVFKKNRNVQCFLYDYVDNQRGLHQPWTCFWQALSDMRINGNRDENIEKLMQEGVSFVYGPGYLSEIAPLRVQGLVGMPPYMTAHGAYLSASAQQLIRGSIWDNNIYLFTDIPRIMRNQSISFERIRTNQGVLASAVYSPQKLTAKFEGTGDYVLKVRIPDNISKKDVQMLFNDTQADKFTIEGDTAILKLTLEKGKQVNLMISH